MKIKGAFCTPAQWTEAFLGKSEYADQLPAFDQKICEFQQEIVQMTADTADAKPQILSKKRTGPCMA